MRILSYSSKFWRWLVFQFQMRFQFNKKIAQPEWRRLYKKYELRKQLFREMLKDLQDAGHGKELELSKKELLWEQDPEYQAWWAGRVRIAEENAKKGDSDSLRLQWQRGDRLNDALAREYGEKV